MVGLKKMCCPIIHERLTELFVFRNHGVDATLHLPHFLLREPGEIVVVELGFESAERCPCGRDRLFHEGRWGRLGGGGDVERQQTQRSAT